MPSAAPRWTVLVVDDEPDVAETLRSFLEGTVPGLEVVVATSGPQGLEVLRSRSVDLVLTDYRMPGMNGMVFLSEATKVAPNVPRIMLTAFPDMRLALQALQLQRAVHFFTKPFDPEEVREVVVAVLDRSFSPLQRAAAFRRSLQLGRLRSGEPPPPRTE